MVMKYMAALRLIPINSPGNYPCLYSHYFNHEIYFQPHSHLKQKSQNREHTLAKSYFPGRSFSSLEVVWGTAFVEQLLSQGGEFSLENYLGMLLPK